MKPRLTAAVTVMAILAAITVSLAGCSAPAPTPTSSASRCSPATAKVFWGAGTRTTDVPLGVHVVTYTADGASSDESTTFVVTPTYTDSAISTLSHLSGQAPVTWKHAVLMSARSISSIGAEYGASVALGDNFVEIDKPTAGIYVVEVGENQLELPFAVSCSGHDPVTGTITAALTGGKAGYAIRCGAPLTADAKRRPGTVVALKYCPSPEPS